MVARILDPKTDALVLMCGPGWGRRCGAAGEDAKAVFCAGHPVLIERRTPEGLRTLRVLVPASQRTCPFGPPAAPAP
jgi:hypothetical protein